MFMFDDHFLVSTVSTLLLAPRCHRLVLFIVKWLIYTHNEISKVRCTHLESVSLSTYLNIVYGSIILRKSSYHWFKIQEGQKCLPIQKKKCHMTELFKKEKNHV